MVGFEIKPLANENPQAIIAGSLRILERAWELINA
jgi:hypothetical protein